MFAVLHWSELHLLILFLNSVLLVPKNNCHNAVDLCEIGSGTVEAAATPVTVGGRLWRLQHLNPWHSPAMELGAWQLGGRWAGWGRNGWVGWGQWAVTIDGQKGVIILKMDMNNHSKRIWELESILTLLWSFIMYYFDLPRGGDIHWITRTRKQTWLARGLLDGKRIYVLDCQRVWDINDLRWVNGWFIDCSWGHNTQTLSSALGLPWFSWSIHCMGLGSLICTILHLRSRLELRKAKGRASGSLGS